MLGSRTPDSQRLVLRFRSGWTTEAQSLDLLAKGDCAKRSPLCTLRTGTGTCEVEALLTSSTLSSSFLFSLSPSTSLEVDSQSSE